MVWRQRPLVCWPANPGLHPKDQEHLARLRDGLMSQFGASARQLQTPRSGWEMRIVVMSRRDDLMTVRAVRETHESSVFDL